MALADTAKQNPIKTAAAVIIAVGSIATTAWAFESHYNQQDEIYVVQNDVMDYQIRQTEDKVFEYDLKESEGDATSVDKAMNKRAKEYLKSLREKQKERAK